QSTTSVNKFGLAGTVTFADLTTTTTARIGSGSVVTAGGHVTVSAQSVELPEFNAISFLNPTKSFSKPENRASLSFSVGLIDDTSDASIDGSASVTVGGDLAVSSLSKIPYEIQWDKFTRLSDYTDKLNYNLGIQNGFFDTWAESLSTAQKNSFGASV